MSRLSIRPAKIADCFSLARVMTRANEKAFRGRVPDVCLDSLTLEQSAKNWAKNFTSNGDFKQSEYLLVATVSKQVIGFVLSATPSEQQKSELPGLENYARELKVLSVDPQWHRKGAGRRLVGALASSLAAEKETHLLVRCLKDNPYCIFYERLGAVRLGVLPYTWEGYRIEEVLYGWSNIANFGVGT